MSQWMIFDTPQCARTSLRAANPRLSPLPVPSLADFRTFQEEFSHFLVPLLQFSGLIGTPSRISPDCTRDLQRCLEPSTQF